MPELPEVETVRRGLDRATVGLEIAGGEVLLERTLARPLSAADFLAGVRGKAIARWHRRGKYLLAELAVAPGARETDPPAWLGVHLRMSGQLLWIDPETPLSKHARVRLFFGRERELRFVDPRTFGRMWWVPPGVEPSKVVTGLQNLGPEPFSDAFSPEYLHRCLHRRQRPIKSALLDQAIVAGVGNIYADETLFLAGIYPARRCCDLETEAFDRLRACLQEVLQQAIAAGGTTLRDFTSIEGTNGNYGGAAWVYRRTGQPCRRCGTIVERIKLSGRSTHFCPCCQRP